MSACGTEGINNQLINRVGCNPPLPCPPCVSDLEEELLVLINANADAIAEIESGQGANMLANWTFN